jgi:hypothetical protein
MKAITTQQAFFSQYYFGPQTGSTNSSNQTCGACANH